MIKLTCYLIGAILLFVGLESLRTAFLLPLIFAGSYFVVSLLLFAGAIGIMYYGSTSTTRKHRVIA